MKATGTVKWFDDYKGWGFLVPDDGGEDCFVHHTCIAGDGYRTLANGARVEFDLIRDGKGPRAMNVRELDQ